MAEVSEQRKKSSREVQLFETRVLWNEDLNLVERKGKAGEELEVLGRKMQELESSVSGKDHQIEELKK